MRNTSKSTPSSTSVITLSQAIFTVNRHAKTAGNPKYLYSLKKRALMKMIREGKAKKVGLHFSNNPKNSQQQSDVLIDCGDYTFHIPPSKEDFKALPHLGSLNQSLRNPRCKMGLQQAKGILEQYTGMSEQNEKPRKPGKNNYQKPVFKKLGDSFF
ncbi:YkyB family protein [Rossellomorea aquimaris]|uniref:YkyB family protein n=1 Tax=Rossellomorea aquimaris TaxID=189382 RepID=UPI0005C89C45|nr:YkyB family protein [Rossellomorea aquimaris]